MDPKVDIWDRAMDSLIASGPLAIVMGVALVVLWRAYQQLLGDLLGYFKAAGKDEKKP